MSIPNVHPRRGDRCIRSVRPVLLLLLFPLSLVLRQAAAAEPTRVENPRRPVLVVAAHSIDRILQGVETVAECADRRDMYEMLTGLLANFGNFEGIDRARPFGVMVSMTNSLPPKPEVIGFLPVADRAKLLQTLAFGPIQVRPVPEKPDRHELKGPDGSLVLQYHGEYAYLARTGRLLDAPPHDPIPLTAPLIENHDVAARLDLAAIPRGWKTLALGFARVRADADVDSFAKRPGVDADELVLRRNFTKATFDSLDRMLSQTREVVVGFHVSPTERRARLDLKIVGDDGPAIAESAPSADPIPNPGAARLSLKYTIPESHRPWIQDLLSLAQNRVKSVGILQEAESEQAFGALRSTVKSGELAAELSVVGTPPGPYAVVGRWTLHDSERLAGVLPNLVAAAARVNERITTQGEVHRHSEIDFHRIQAQGLDQGEGVAAQKPTFALVGAGKKHIWFALGESSPEKELNRELDRLEPTASDSGDHLRFEMSAGHWIAGLKGDGDETRERLRTAFARGQDRLIVHLSAAAGSPQLRISLDAGYLRLLGLDAARAIDR